MDGNKTQKDFWLRLDNAAKIYPAITDSELTSVIRISTELKERIKANHLISAVKEIENRFPYYKVKLKAGFFWYYLEYFDTPVKITADLGTPCRKFEENELMYRILVKNNRLSVEFSHIITDGTGAFEYLKTLLFTYFKKCGHSIPQNIPYHKPQEAPSQEEYEDSFNKNFRKVNSPPEKLSPAFHLPFPLKEKPRFDHLVGIIALDEIKEKSNAQGVSITEYLIAVYLHALQELYYELPEVHKKKSNKIIRIEVPINLRKMYNSKTMRNFSLYVMPGIDLRLGHYSFDEILKTVHHQMQLESEKKTLSKMMSYNVGSEKNFFIKSVPLIIKSFILSKMYALGTSVYSGVITNLGMVNFSELNNLIKRFTFIPPPANEILKLNCGVVGFDNKLVLSFGNISTSKKLEQKFFKFLTGKGIHVKIENY